LTAGLPRPRSASDAVIASIASGEVRPSNLSELTSRSAPEWATNASSAGASPPAGSTTRRISRSNLRANSKSRWSCAGTAMIAPVP
jgi:hypothetical protein